MAWIYLLLAGLCEVGWPIGLKLGWGPTGARFGWITFAVLFMAVSGVLLMLAQRDIPMGTAYAVWTGIGAAGTIVIGMMAFGEPTDLFRVARLI